MRQVDLLASCCNRVAVRFVMAFMLALATTLPMTGTALALSADAVGAPVEGATQPSDTPVPDNTDPAAEEPGALVPDGADVDRAPLSPIPLPDPITPGQLAPATPDETDITGPRGDTVHDGPILDDITALPEPVQRMRQLIIDAARSGDPERLRPLLGVGDAATQLSVVGETGDPVGYIKGHSGDPGGQEILAIMLDLLDARFVLRDEGTERAVYVWPYFVDRRLDALTPEERVEMFRIVTAGDYEDMLSFGAYSFYRIGITPEGEWVFFVAGD